MKSGRQGLLVLAALLALLPLLPEEAATQGAPAGEKSYVGSETCAMCHESLWEELKQTPHGKRGFAELSEHGCETCHGPGSLHVEDPEDPALRPSFIARSPEEQNETCTTCHDGGKQTFWQGSPHETRGLTCTSCHGVHNFQSEDSQIKTAQAMDTCFTCHADVRADLWKTSHHPIREGRIECIDCHNPHGTIADTLIDAVSVNEQCYTCHTEKRGPFLWDHAPVRESCLNCHVPHGSNHIKLQKTTVPYICQQCHSNTRHPGTLYDATRLPTLENPETGSNRIFNRACLDCHSNIHGSNHPSGPYLGR